MLTFEMSEWTDCFGHRVGCTLIYKHGFHQFPLIAFPYCNDLLSDQVVQRIVSYWTATAATSSVKARAMLPSGRYNLLNLLYHLAVFQLPLDELSFLTPLF